MNHSLYQDEILKALPFKRLPWWIAESTNRRTAFKIANVSIPASKFMGPFAFLPTAK
jgi:hypothetical protein